MLDLHKYIEHDEFSWISKYYFDIINSTMVILRTNGLHSLNIYHICFILVSILNKLNFLGYALFASYHINNLKPST